jgi:tetratricopeptide (TPR) repeat protein
LPESENPDAVKAYEEARVDMQNQSNWPAAVVSLKHAVEIDPKYVRAWLWLGEIYKLNARQLDSAVEAYRTAIEIDPDVTVSYKALGNTLMDMHKYEEAIPVWQGLIERDPENSAAPESLGKALLNLKRYDEAAEAFLTAIRFHPDYPGLQLSLGSAYGRGGKDEKALIAFKKAIESIAGPGMLNAVAYELAEENKNLPIALEYSQKAVRHAEEQTQKLKLDDLTVMDLESTKVLAFDWDTLGWVYFRMGELDKAEKYLQSAWLLSEGPVEGEHLGEVYEQQKRKAAAVQLYRLALAASPLQSGGVYIQTEQTIQKIVKLGGSIAKPKQNLNHPEEELSRMRIIKLPRLISETASAEFFVLIGRDSKVDEVKFISGSDKLKTADKALASAEFDLPLPDEVPTRIIRRGILGCYAVTGCSFVMYPTYDVKSVN